MNLVNDFFKINKIIESVNSFIADIELNPKHFVYDGHFPGHPVTPGAIQIQIVHELLETFFGQKLMLREIIDCKFLNILNPIESSKLLIQIDFEKRNNILSIKANGKNNLKLHFKLHSVYQFNSK